MAELTTLVWPWQLLIGIWTCYRRCMKRCMLYVANSMKIQSMHIIWHGPLHVVFMMCIIKSIIWTMTSRCNMHTIIISSNINMKICGTSKIIIRNIWCNCMLYLRCGVVILLWKIRMPRYGHFLVARDASGLVIIKF